MPCCWHCAGLLKPREAWPRLPKKAQVPRESLYRALSLRGNPALSNLLAILHGMGLKITIQPEKTAAAA